MVETLFLLFCIFFVYVGYQVAVDRKSIANEIDTGKYKEKKKSETVWGAEEKAVDKQVNIFFSVIAVGALAIIIFFVINKGAEYNEANILGKTATFDCIGLTYFYKTKQDFKNECKNRSVKITAFIVDENDDRLTLNVNQQSELSTNKYNNFVVIKNNKDYFGKNKKVEVKGVFSGVYGLLVTNEAHINASQITEVLLNAEENNRLELLKNKGTAEAQIAIAREEGAKALEEFDTLLRNNVAERRKALEDAAVEHKRINTSGPTMTDGYTMKDGRLIICTTKVLSSAPAIMECDGEP
ncbi:hypothetical protein [Methylomicrobium agile]|uniref:hypothetical protein n=1 Tax=Methylomicrobium agile TaxID=39774 RepID=UPI0004DF6379|nr:hypothetical protein [Methylomicrobium agile]